MISNFGENHEKEKEKPVEMAVSSSKSFQGCHPIVSHLLCLPPKFPEEKMKGH